MANREMLNLWAEHREEIERICELLGHLEGNGIILWMSPRKPDAVVAEHFGIDLVELENERRALASTLNP
jgi:hypothetical protein